jgi:hypothetical protein
VIDAGATIDADAIGGGADDIGRAPVIVTTAICSGTTGCPVGGDSRRGSDGGAMGLGEEQLAIRGVEATAEPWVLRGGGGT